MFRHRQAHGQIVYLLLAVFSLLSGWCQAVGNENGMTVLRTGGSEPLISFEAPLGPIAADSEVLLEFDFGFSTSEPATSATFFDSFSLTLQNTNSQESALLSVVDRDGVRWAPTNPGGLDLSNEDLRHNPIAFPNLTPSHLVQFAFHVVLAIPRGLTAGTLTLFADLFDNGNESGSLAFLSGLVVRANNAPLRLQSSSEGMGPYLDETPLEATQNAITVSKIGGQRFYRFSSARPTRILEQRIFPERVVLDYRYEPLTGLRLQGAASLELPFTDVTNANWNPTNRTFSVPQSSGLRAFRVVGDHLALVQRVSTVGENIVIEYLSALIELRSTSTLGRSSTMVSRNPDQASRTFRVNPASGREFFVVRSDVRTAVSLRRDGSELVITYEVRP